LALAALACVAVVVPAAVLAGSSGEGPVAAGERLTPDQLSSTTNAPYIIGPADKLTIRVFEVKDLSFESEQVDASGYIMLPLVGKLQAAGKSPDQLEEEITERLGKYLQSPQVTVSIVESASQKVTVEGNVKNPGVYLVRGQTTLMQAVAMAGGVDSEADTHKVAVIRLEGGIRKAATVDYAAVKAGKAPDPLIQGNDDVVVGESTAKMVWANVIRNLPIFTLLTYVR
ncbi:MAG TPA: polysaccharide biosynthesis/export family protein, partial [Caulobacteraceae bacterium]|nr:polysaccharide biosynthesis/export family protein [Caulobacteraceae bacterium]